MTKTVLITGATDGIGFETAKSLIKDGHKVIIHGRNPEKLTRTVDSLGGDIENHIADLSNLDDVVALADAISKNHDHLDVLINNAGIFKTPAPVTKDGLDIRFVVNTIAPYLLTKKLSPLLGQTGRVVNLSSAAQAPVDFNALAGKTTLAAMDAYAQSKLAITMWTADIAKDLQSPVVIAVNPGSLLASKMVKEGFGVSGNDLSIGVDILTRAALAPDFADASGKYFDNDSGKFALPHPGGQDEALSAKLVQTIESIIAELS